MPQKILEAIDGLETGLQWFESLENVEYIQILHLRSIIETAKKQKRAETQRLF